jgi:formylglycine-generating enzyme required for sulfatase activity
MIDYEDQGSPPAEAKGQGTVAEQEIARLRAELAALRDRPPARDVDSVTEQVALQQEVATLQQIMRNKERILDVTAAQCRRLEDELEDQRVAFDTLKQELERKALSLDAARDQNKRLEKERREIEERYQASLIGSTRKPPRGPRSSSRASARGREPRAFLDGRFFVGLIIGIVLAAAIAGFLKPDFLGLTGDQAPTRAGTAPPPRTDNPQEPGSGEPVAPGEMPREAEEGEQPTLPSVLRTVRDPLRSGGVGPLMVAIQGGTFTMGKLIALPTDDAGPAREVTVPGFLVGATEVTFEDYDRFVRATGERSPSDFGWGRGRRPVVDVSWDDARRYTDWLARQTGQRYRLPTEAEWEYMASAGRRSPFWWGFELEPARAVCFDCGSIWDNVSTAPVGTFEPNPLGLFDTAGNAMEWVQDCHHPNYTGAPLDGRAWEETGCQFRVARGGAFNKPARSMHTTARRRFAPDTRLNMIGFRVARDQ